MDAYIGASNDRHGSLKKDAKKMLENVLIQQENQKTISTPCRSTIFRYLEMVSRIFIIYFYLNTYDIVKIVAENEATPGE